MVTIFFPLILILICQFNDIFGIIFREILGLQQENAYLKKLIQSSVSMKPAAKSWMN